MVVGWNFSVGPSRATWNLGANKMDPRVFNECMLTDYYT